MENLSMNTSMGKKWFVFYAKVRPWFACVSFLSILIDFVQHSDVYFSSIFYIIYLIGSIVLPVLAVMVVVKSDGNYGHFVDFVKKVLLFETIFLSYQTAVNQYFITAEFGFCVAFFAVVVVIMYFTWYRLNVKYFEKRIVREIITTIASDDETDGDTNPQTSPLVSSWERANYCSNCGKNITDDATYCSGCGRKIDK